MRRRADLVQAAGTSGTRRRGKDGKLRCFQGLRRGLKVQPRERSRHVRRCGRGGQRLPYAEAKMPPRSIARHSRVKRHATGLSRLIGGVCRPW